MPGADAVTYLAEVAAALRKHWPENRIVNIACHGHSVPAGYFATPFVNTFNAYPHLLHRELKHRFPFAVLNVVVTAIGGEDSASGAARFRRDVLSFRPDVVTIDYGLNDRRLGLEKARAAWEEMIAAATEAGAKILLLTPTADVTQRSANRPKKPQGLRSQAEQIRELAAKHETGLVDCLAAFERYRDEAGDLTDLLSWSNHPNRRGHELVVRELLRWFPAA